MFGTNVVRSGLSLGKVLSGISKGLTIANQVIPIYEQAKPMISNARKFMGAMKEFTKATNEVVPKKETKNIIDTPSQEKKTTPQHSLANPVFFQ